MEAVFITVVTYLFSCYLFISFLSQCTTPPHTSVHPSVDSSQDSHAENVLWKTNDSWKKNYKWIIFLYFSLLKNESLILDMFVLLLWVASYYFVIRKRKKLVANYLCKICIKNKNCVGVYSVIHFAVLFSNTAQCTLCSKNNINSINCYFVFFVWFWSPYCH